MKDLNKIGRQCMEDLEAIGYLFPKRIVFLSSGRMKKTWGLCTTYSNRDYTEVKIANFLLQDDVEEKMIRQTVYHELAHAIDENKHGHDKEWKNIADDISDCYGVDIQKYCTQEEIKSLKHTVMYQEKCTNKEYAVICVECGKKHNRYGLRAPKWYAHPNNFKCKCGGKLKRV